MTCKIFYRVNPQTDERWKSYLCDTFEELPTEGCIQGEWAVVKTPTRRMFLHSGSGWEEKGAGAAAWGSITGTLSSQTDLNSALSGKSDAGHNHSGTYEPANANIQSHVTTPHAPASAQANADITKAEIEAKLTGVVSSHSHAGGSEAFPVGSVFISVVSTNPNTLLGYGTWATIATGRMLIGLNSGDTDFDTVEETGGGKTKTIAQANLPNISTGAGTAHTHNFLPRSATTGSVSSIVTGTLDTSSTISGANQPHVQTENAHTHSLGGSGTALNVVNPYFVVYMWKRTV